MRLALILSTLTALVPECAAAGGYWACLGEADAETRRCGQKCVATFAPTSGRPTDAQLERANREVGRCTRGCQARLDRELIPGCKALRSAAARPGPRAAPLGSLARIVAVVDRFHFQANERSQSDQALRDVLELLKLEGRKDLHVMGFHALNGDVMVSFEVLVGARAEVYGLTAVAAGTAGIGDADRARLLAPLLLVELEGVGRKYVEAVDRLPWPYSANVAGYSVASSGTDAGAHPISVLTILPLAPPPGP